MGVPVSVLLRRKGDRVVSLTTDATVRDAASRLAAENIGAVIITEPDGALAGILSERDIVRELGSTGQDVLDGPVARAMTEQVKTCSPTTNTDELMQLMTERRIRHVPVVDDAQKLVGVISIGDVVKWRLDELRTEAEALSGYVAGSY